METQLRYKIDAENMSERKKELFNKILDLTPMMYGVIRGLLPRLKDESPDSYRDIYFQAAADCMALYKPIVDEWRLSKAEYGLVYNAINRIVRSKVMLKYENPLRSFMDELEKGKDFYLTI